ncbi:GNAT family N-acetyltransferase [Halobacillus litoralis]|uniref:GNAT family N-acetyltransferase n=1 Tax=Halobacillus litoralis TaxID=45668 RepID=UPI001CD7C133|nr:GNAT family N-acetyltransferase [Halobacillus litoralis]MCA0972408.1 GNAT family N-acetyltransferase [Halobacillus litoralis]
MRHRILRPHQPFEACVYQADSDEETLHVGAFQDDQLISIGSFYHEKDRHFSEPKQCRLRAMATEPDFRDHGAGRAVVEFGEEAAKKKGYHVLWCQGRTSVQVYYEKLGFKPYGEVFDYPPIGPHIVMGKPLK